MRFESTAGVIFHVGTKTCKPRELPRRFMGASGSRIIVLMLCEKRRVKVYRTKATVFADFAAARFG